MSILKHLFIFVLIGSVVVGSARLITVNSSAADAQFSPFEVTVSSISDPDPRDDTSIAVSPQNDRIIVGASKVVQGGATSAQGNSLVAYYFSSDGGQTWGSGLAALETPQKTWGRQVDPSVASDLDGNFYLCVRMLDNNNFDTGVYVFKSTDGGRTFTNPTPVVTDIGNLVNPLQAGKCHMTVDASSSSPFKGTVYAVWTSTGLDATGQNGTRVQFARRKPGDASFSVSKPISHVGDMRGPSVTTGASGEVCAAWVGMPARSLLFNASTDGGDTFLQGLASLDVTVRQYVGSLDGPNQSFFISGLPRENSYPTLDMDRSTGPNRGKVYVAWAETTNGIDTDIFVETIALQQGTVPEVSFPVKVNNDGSGVDQFFPWLSVDSSSGAVEIAFSDRRDNSGTNLMNMYLARSTDGGLSFGENTRISSVSSDPTIQANIAGVASSAIGMGDYVGLVASRGRAHMLWTDTRRRKQEIFYGQLNFGSAVPPPPPPPDGLAGDTCQSPRVITSLPYLDTVDTRIATSSADDPISCTGGQDTNTLWYSITPAVNTTYGVDTTLSDYDTVVSVYTGSCGSLTRVACSDDFGNPPDAAKRSVLTFPATAGVPYLILASGKGSGGSLKMRLGYPTITSIAFTSVPFGDSLEIHGGFPSRDCVVTAQQNGEDIPLPNLQFLGPPLPDGSNSAIWASRKKLTKVLKHGSLLVRVECPAGSGNMSNAFLFTR